jgi:hypothetical protein
MGLPPTWEEENHEERLHLLADLTIVQGGIGEFPQFPANKARPQQLKPDSKQYRYRSA